MEESSGYWSDDDEVIHVPYTKPDPPLITLSDEEDDNYYRQSIPQNSHHSYSHSTIDNEPAKTTQQNVPMSGHSSFTSASISRPPVPTSTRSHRTTIEIMENLIMPLSNLNVFIAMDMSQYLDTIKESFTVQTTARVNESKKQVQIFIRGHSVSSVAGAKAQILNWFQDKRNNRHPSQSTLYPSMVPECQSPPHYTSYQNQSHSRNPFPTSVQQQCSEVTSTQSSLYNTSSSFPNSRVQCTPFRQIDSYPHYQQQQSVGQAAWMWPSNTPAGQFQSEQGQPHTRWVGNNSNYEHTQQQQENWRWAHGPPGSRCPTRRFRRGGRGRRRKNRKQGSSYNNNNGTPKWKRCLENKKRKNRSNFIQFLRQS